MQKVTDPDLLATLNGGATAPARPQGSTQAPVFIPNAAGQRKEAREQIGTDIAVEGNSRDAERFGNDTRNQNFNQLRSISDAYNKDPTVAAYRERLPFLGSALKTAENPFGDNTLTILYVKTLDDGVVNEGERAGVADAQGALASRIEKAKRDFGLNEKTGMYTPENRARIRREIFTNMGGRVKGYNQRRAYYQAQAEAFGIDPKLVIGNHDADPFVGEIREYDRANKLGEYAPGRDGAIPGQAGGQNPFQGVDPSQITFDMDTGTGAFGSEIEGKRLSPEQQAEYAQFIKAMGQNLTPESLNAWWQSKGFGGLSNAADVVKAAKAGTLDLTVNYSNVDAEKKRLAMEASYKEIPEGGDVSAAGRDKGLLLNMTDELRGGVGGIKSLLSGDGFMSGYERERDIERASQERSRQENGIAPEFIAGLMTPAGVISRANMARDAAAMGAIAGFGEGEGLSDSAAKAVTGAGLGYGGGKLVEKVAPTIAGAVQPLVEKAKDAITRPGQREFVAAADRLGLDYMAADIPNATGSRFATSLSKMTLGGVPITDRARKLVDAAAEAKTNIARSLAPKSDVQGAGQAAKRGLSQWEAGAKTKSAQMHEAVPIPADRAAEMGNTRAALADINAGLSSNKALSSEIADPAMVRFQQALEGEGLNWADMKRFRTYIGEQVGKPSIEQKMSKSDLRKLYAGLSEDMRATAKAEGPKALAAFERANSYTRGMEQRREEVLTSILGKGYDKGDEASFNQVMNWAKLDSGDWAKLGRAMRSLPEEDANIVRAQIIDRLGMARKGAQDANAEVFSPSEYMTQWNALDKRAKNVLFQGPQRKALEDLATYFDGVKTASQQFANTSRTGLINSSLATAGTFGLDVVTGTLAGIFQLGAGKYLASESFANWMSALIKKPNPAAVLQHIERLTAVARAEPVIANDIFTLQQRLAETFAPPQSLRAAAEENDKVGDQKIREGERNGPQ